MTVLFATPTKDKEVSVDFHTSLIQTMLECIKHGIACDSRIIAGLPFIDLARNRLVDAFLKGPYTDIFFIDADQGWDAKAVPRFLRYEEDVVCGLPPKKCNPVEYHSNAITGVISKDGLFQSLEVGTGFMRIKRAAFEKLDKAFPELKFAGGLENPETGYFQTGIYNGGLGEDIFFCRKWVEMGERLWIDPDVDFTHRGSYAWKGNFYDHAVAMGMLKTTPTIKVA